MAGPRKLFFSIHVFLSLLLLLINSDLFVHSFDSLPCSSVKYAYTAKGFDDGDVPSAAISGEHLRICERGLTCCTEEMEHKLSTYSRAEFDKLLQNSIGELKTLFDTHGRKFDEFFKELLKISRTSFHNMFVKTYGMLYEQNSYLFSTMFDDLEKYYFTGGVNLEEAMDDFFHRLYARMFQVLNSQHQFDDRYLNCVMEFMNEMKPFGEVPNKLITDIKRSFIATRTFVQALNVGRDVIKNIMEVGPTQECSRALMKMTYCPHCHGLPDLKPCSSYCLQVLNSCLNNHVELSAEWTAFIDALVNLVSRMENSFNIESVLEPVDIKISEAIMNFQENGPAISKKLFQKCGRPRLGKRDISEQEISLEKLKFQHQNVVRPTTAAGTSMDRLVSNLKKKTKRIKKFWSELPSTMCAHPHVADEPQRQEGCWDGNGKRKNVSSSNSVLYAHIETTTVSENHQNAIINQQILTLKLITSKLTNAYKGMDVEWEDSYYLSSGSGSGSGSGDGMDASPGGLDDIFFSVPTASSTERAPPVYHHPQNPQRPQQPTKTTTSSASHLFSKEVHLVLVIIVSVIYFS